MYRPAKSVEKCQCCQQRVTLAYIQHDYGGGYFLRALQFRRREPGPAQPGRRAGPADSHPEE